MEETPKQPQTADPDPDLRPGRTWLAPFIAVLAFLGFGVLLFLPLPRVFQTPLGQSFLNATHLPVFAVFAWAGAVLWRRFGHWKCEHAALIATGLVILGALAVEVVQPVFGRSGSWEDAGIGMLGTMVFLLGTRWLRPGSGRAGFWKWAAFTVAAVLLVCRPILREFGAIGQRNAAFPVLGDFEHAAELSYWIPAGYLEPRPELVHRVAEPVRHGRHSLRVDASVGKWPGVFLNTGGQDWSNHRELALELHNPGEPFKLGIRLDDEHPDSEFWGYRYDGVFTLTNRWNPIRIPVRTIAKGGWRRGMNVTDIRRMILFVDPETKPRVFHVDHVRLQ